MKITIFCALIMLCLGANGQSDTTFVPFEFNYSSTLIPKLIDGVLFSLDDSPNGLEILGVASATSYKLTILDGDSVVYETTDIQERWMGVDIRTGGLAEEGTYSYEIIADEAALSGNLIFKP